MGHFFITSDLRNWWGVALNSHTLQTPSMGFHQLGWKQPSKLLQGVLTEQHWVVWVARRSAMSQGWQTP